MDILWKYLERRDGRQQAAMAHAVAELRSGRPVVLAGETLAVVACAEFVDAGALAFFTAREANAHVVLPAPRLRRLGLADRSEAGSVRLAGLDQARIADLILSAEATLGGPVAAASVLDESALDLARIALMLPACLVAPLTNSIQGSMDVVTVEASAIRAHRGGGVRLVSRAPVPLEGAPDSEFVVFRGGDGWHDHVAILIGRPATFDPVAVRLHSACLTGDLFGSLKCDCGDQLRGAVKDIAAMGGGIILYLDQEGRGNGLANKIRAYDLQTSGFDTFEADEILGYGLDQRRYDFAASLLHQLNVRRIRLLSNNPAKIAALQAAGLDVVASHPSLGRVTEENVLYLTQKRDRTEHTLGSDIERRVGSQNSGISEDRI